MLTSCWPITEKEKDQTRKYPITDKKYYWKITLLHSCGIAMFLVTSSIFIRAFVILDSFEIKQEHNNYNNIWNEVGNSIET